MTVAALPIIEPVAPTLSPLGSVGQVAPMPSASRFEAWMTQELHSMNTSMVQAEQGVRDLASGAAVNVHDVMLQMEQARLQFQLALQVRNKVIEGYQEILRMQV